MSDILAVFRVEHPSLALTDTAAHDPSATIRPIRDAGTDPEGSRYLFSVTSEDFERFEDGLAGDRTVERFERVATLADERVYAVTYSGEAVLFSTEVGRQRGAILDLENDGTTWVFKTWFPHRRAAQAVWEYAVDHDVTIDLERINAFGGVGSSRYGLTDKQWEAIMVALEAGYFDEPRGATLGEVAGTLGISEPAASGLVRRGIKRLLLATLAEEDA